MTEITLSINIIRAGLSTWKHENDQNHQEKADIWVST